MIFILEESYITGTVTVAISAHGIEANNFDEAVEIVKKIVLDKYPETVFRQGNSLATTRIVQSIYYTIPGELPTHGRMTSEEFKILNKKG